MKNLFVGSAGVLWALDALRRRGHAETTLDLADLAIRNVELFRERPDIMKIPLPEPKESALLEGETGILLVALRLAPRARPRGRPARARARERLERGRGGHVGDARHADRGTGDARVDGRGALARRVRESADALWSRRDADGLWSRGSTTASIGTSGRCTASSATCRPSRPSSTKRVARASNRDRSRPRGTAVVEDGLANWPPGFAGSSVAATGPSGCSGATARRAWSRSPRRTSTRSCCSPAPSFAGGPGRTGRRRGRDLPRHGRQRYALLKAFERTGDELWLDRARRFAVHALGQVARARVARGSGRYSSGRETSRSPSMPRTPRRSKPIPVLRCRRFRVGAPTRGD